MAVLKGEPLSVGTSGPPSLLSALQLWGTTQPKAPCLTALDTAGKATYTLTYGKYQQAHCATCLPRTVVCGPHSIGAQYRAEKCAEMEHLLFCSSLYLYL